MVAPLRSSVLQLSGKMNDLPAVSLCRRSKNKHDANATFRVSKFLNRARLVPDDGWTNLISTVIRLDRNPNRTRDKWKGDLSLHRRTWSRKWRIGVSTSFRAPYVLGLERSLVIFSGSTSTKRQCKELDLDHKFSQSHFSKHETSYSSKETRRTVHRDGLDLPLEEGDEI